MSTELAQHPISCANGSGFPLQIAAAAAINKSHHWRVLVEEHPWRSAGGAEGFIDIIAANRKSQPHFEVLVIECKRVRQAGWVFLVPKLPPSDRRHAVIWGSHLVDATWRVCGWEDWACDPPSPRSEYCAIPGQEQGRKNLLERSTSELIESVEALATQEKVLQERKQSKGGFARIYIPVLVTTAKLLVSYFDPESIALAEGTLSKDTPTKEVPFVRFHKGLGAYKEQPSANTIEEIHSLSQRTVFVVNAESLTTFLNTFEPDE